MICLYIYIYIYTVGPPNTANLGTDKKAAVFGNRRYLEIGGIWGARTK